MSDKHITLLTHIRGKVAREAPYAGGDAWTEALDWAIDQLRWRRVESEFPSEDGVYLVLPMHHREKHIPPAATFYRHRDNAFLGWPNAGWWRPIELPEAA